MRYLFIALLVIGLWACDDDEFVKPDYKTLYAEPICNYQVWKCDSNKVMYCYHSVEVDYYEWQVYQNCTATGRSCYPAYSGECGGYEYPCCH